MVFVDVGQGDGMLILSPTGKSVLIDAGLRKSAPAMLDVLRKEKVSELDLAIATHPHADHIGGISDVLQRVPTKLFMDSGFAHPSGTYRQLLEFLETSKTKVITARSGRKIDLGGGAVMEVLAPREHLLRGTRSDANSNSVVVRVTHGDVSVLLTGDAEDPTERRLMEEPSKLASTILKVAHHGSEHSSSSTFLGHVKPKAAIISCGLNNKYGHPAAGTLSRLQRMGAAIYRTDLQGDLRLVTDGERWTIQTERQSATADAVPMEASPEAAGDGAININTADADTLTSLPGIGPKKAQAIIDHRQKSGAFATVDQLTDVRGIGAKTLAKLRPLITVGEPAQEP